MLIKSLLKKIIIIGFILFIMCLGMVTYWWNNLPSVEELKEVKLQVPLRVYTHDGLLLGEFGEKRRNPVNIDEIPKQLINAVIATEDARFYSHPGVDIRSLLRAFVSLISTGEKGQGGSTITMQVARNFYLNRKKTFGRKFIEILLSLKIERNLTKEEILNLYLNKIYLGKRAYGVAAAAEVYYGKELHELNLAEMAIIAGLPQAPSSLNPINSPEKAKKRRQHVLERMLHYGYISESDLKEAAAMPITTKYHFTPIEIYAPYISEMARKEAVKIFGEEAYNMGLKIYTTIDSELQSNANKALIAGLQEYDKRHGFRKHKITSLEASNDNEIISHLKTYSFVEDMSPAYVKKIANNQVEILLPSGNDGIIKFEDMKWAKAEISQEENILGSIPQKPSDVLDVGNIIYVKNKLDNYYQLAQIPEVQGALISMDTRNGAIKALVGGYDYPRNNFNRVTQAKRQPGSTFKPFVYGAALEQGLTLATVINDAPLVETSSILGQEDWRPKNHTNKFNGPTRLRDGLTKSLNMVSIRILKTVGLENAVEFASRFGFDKNSLAVGNSLALGSVETTPLELTRGFAAFANGGYKVEPYFISHVTDINDKTIFMAKPYIAAENLAPRAVSPQVAFLVTSLLEGVMKNGTGRKAKVLNRSDLAGKTGTTNEQRNVWFVGYNPNLVTTTWMGFDDERKSLHEYGASTALPMWIKFMEYSKEKIPESYFSIPDGIVSAKIDPETGLLAQSLQSNAMFEYFIEGTVPTKEASLASHIVDEEESENELF